MKKLVLLFAMTLMVINAFSQYGQIPIIIQKNKYFQNDQRLSNSQLKQILLKNSNSAPEFELYRKSSSIGLPLNYAGTICVFTGSVLMFASTVQQIGNPFNKNSQLAIPLMIFGLGLGVVGLPFNLNATKHLKKAVSLYNSDIKEPTYSAMTIGLMVNSNGLGLALKF